MKLKFIFPIALIALMFASCEKCMECTYVQLDGTLVSQEKCGNKDEIEAFENEVEDEAYEHREHPECSHYK